MKGKYAVIRNDVLRNYVMAWKTAHSIVNENTSLYTRAIPTFLIGSFKRLKMYFKFSTVISK